VQHPDFPGVFQHQRKWRFDIQIEGVRHRQSFADPREAYLMLQQIRANPEQAFVPNNIRFLDYAEEWLRTSKLASSTLDTHRTNLMMHLATLHRRKVCSITIFDVRKVVEEMSKKTRGNGVPYAPLTIRNVLSTLGKIMSRAVSDGIVPVNPVKQLDTDHRPKNRRQKNVRLLESGEVTRLLDCELQWQAVFALALFGGLRKGEIIRLKWKDVDFTEDCIAVPGTKNEASVGTIGMSQRLRKILWAHRDKTEFKFADDPVISTSVRTPWDAGNLDKQVRKLVKAAGLEGLTLHHLRHNVATVMITAGVPDKQIALQMRHANTHVTRTIYEHVYRERETREAATAAIDQIFAEEKNIVLQSP
jgi:integrase